LRLSFPDQASAPGDPLPEYAAPPVVETSVGIQFDGLDGYNSLSVAAFRSQIASDFPAIEELPPLEPAYETFGPGDSRLAQPQIQVIAGAIQPRFCFVALDRSELVQIQRDRLFYNWRKTEKGEAYPRYTHVRRRLETQLALLADWAKRERIGEPVPTQCEAIYVNRIPLADAEGNKCGLSFIFPWLKGLMGMTEDGSFQFRRRLHDETGDPVARLNFNLRYGSDESGGREALLQLHVRGRPSDSTLDGCLRMIDAEREVIVRTFTEITSDAAHQLWERKQ